MSGNVRRKGSPLLKELPSLAYGFVIGFLLACCLTGTRLADHQALGEYASVAGGYRGRGSEFRRADSAVDVSSQQGLELKAASPGDHTTKGNPTSTRIATSRKLLYVGVLSAGKFLKTRIAACNQTWGQDVPGGDIEFYVGEPPKESYTGITIIVLRGVSDHEYPPQRKAFHMLQYVCEHYLDKYHWFLRADDDAYFRIAQITTWLRMRDPNYRYYIGQAGYGRDHDKGRLRLPGDDNFCMGGPGVIMSRAAMQGICPHFYDCMTDNLTKATGEEDVEIGRCFTKYLHVLCTAAYEFMELFYHSYPQEYTIHPYLTFDKHIIKVFQKALTLHHIKTSFVMYDVHNWFMTRCFEDMQEEITVLNGQIKNISSAVLKNSGSTIPEIELPPANMLQPMVPRMTYSVDSMLTNSDPVPQTGFEASDWLYHDSSELLGPPTAIESNSGNESLRNMLTHAVQQAFIERKLNFQKIVRIVTHTDPVGGKQFLMEVSATRSFTNSKSAPVSNFQVEVVQELGRVETKSEYGSLPDDSEVYLILPLSPALYPQFQQFMKMYEVRFLADQPADVGTESPGKVHLCVVLFSEVEDAKSFEPNAAAFDPPLVVSLYGRKYPHVKMHVFSASGAFSLFAAITVAMQSLSSLADASPQENSVVVLTTVDLQLSNAFVADCQSRVHQKDVALFPVPLLAKVCLPLGKGEMPRTPITPGSDPCTNSDTWLTASYVHFCTSFKFLSSSLRHLNASCKPVDMYRHVSVARHQVLDGYSSYRLYDASLKIMWRDSYSHCGNLSNSLTLAAPEEMFAACSNGKDQR